MKENTPYKPDAEDFLEMWKHFNQMAHESNIVETALKRFGQENSAWMNYYLYFNHYQVVGQTLLVYCLREILEVAATHHFSQFDLTGYAMEPEQEHHNEEMGVLREALQDEDILQFASVRNFQELLYTLPGLVQSEGKLKVLVLPVLDNEAYVQYRLELDKWVGTSFNEGDTEYAVLTPVLKLEDQVKWLYWSYSTCGATEPEFLE
jgi:hypothetical protein